MWFDDKEKGTQTQMAKTETGNLLYNTEIDHNMKCCNGSHHGKFDGDDGTREKRKKRRTLQIIMARIHYTKGQFCPIDGRIYITDGTGELLATLKSFERPPASCRPSAKYRVSSSGQWWKERRQLRVYMIKNTSWKSKVENNLCQKNIKFIIQFARHKNEETHKQISTAKEK
jgi:hypothetical protein